MSVSISAVGVLVYRARKQLRRLLTESGETAERLPSTAKLGAGSAGPGKEHS
jgi:hypothetical protein